MQFLHHFLKCQLLGQTVIFTPEQKINVISAIRILTDKRKSLGKVGQVNIRKRGF